MNISALYTKYSDATRGKTPFNATELKKLEEMGEQIKKLATPTGKDKPEQTVICPRASN